MTSPHATTTSAAMATAGVHDKVNPPNIDLTAVDPTEDANTNVEQEVCHETTSQEENKESKIVAEYSGEEGGSTEVQTGTKDAAIPDGADLNQGSQVGFPPPTMADLAQMEALNALMAYAQPIGLYDQDMNALQLPQASAAGLPALQLAMGGSIAGQPYLDSAPYIREVDETRISAYAKLEFEDGEFYMNTYSVILGRDLAAARAAMRRDQEEEKRRIEDEVSAREPKTPVRIKREESRYSKSVISESGGILREGDDSDSDDRARRRKIRKASKKSKSTGSSSQHISRRNSLVQPNGLMTYQPQAQARRTAPDTAGAVPVDPASLRPSPHDCPLVGIHPPAATAASGYKAISRQHVKIAYNSKKYLFEAEIIGRNGAFVDEEFYYHNDVIPLKSGSRLQIGGVVVRFVLPDVAIGETGAEHKADFDENLVGDRYSEGGKEMSFDFEDTPRDGAMMEDTSEDVSDEGGEDDEEPEDENGEDVEDDEELESSDRSALVDGDEKEEGDEEEILPDPVPKPLKKRGPGRPPKNGIMSKREQQLAKKEALAQQKAKKTVPQPPVTGKNKVGRPRKHPRPETPPVKTEKRKYTKRKPKEPKDGIQQEGSGGEDQPTKEKKEKKPPKPPRSPSPKFNEADLTPEQLAKPQANYVTLIHEALSNSSTGQMSLPQIYRAIQRKYPFFVLKCNTNGWQSSVRHNLSQHHAFRKVERDGKGWMWAIVDGVSIEKEKKRRITPPPQMPPGHMHHQPIYQAGHPPHIMTGHPGYGPGIMGPPPGYPMNPHIPTNVMSLQSSPYGVQSRQINGHQLPPGTITPMNGHPSTNFVSSIPPQLAGPNGPTYSSPYAPKPPSSATPQFNKQTPQNEHPPTTQGSIPSATTQNSQIGPPLGPPPPNDNISRAVDTFKTNLIKSLKEKSSNAEAVVASAVNRVLGVTNQSTVPGDPHEDMIMTALRTMLSQIPGSNIKSAQPPSNPTNTTRQENSQRVPQSHQTNQNGTHGNTTQQTPKSIGPEKPGPTVMRPSFAGQSQSRPNGPSVPRPLMMTPGMKRTNSGSPASATARPNAATSASPAPAASAGNGNSTSKVTVTEHGQIAGQKRAHDDADDLREFKRLSTSGLTQLKT